MQKNIVLMIVSLAMFMESVDTTILNTAIPAMAESLQVNPISLKLALISYLMSLAIFTPISGWFADKYGVKKVFIGAIILFTASSIFCGFTKTLLQLVLGRIVQGIGGSMTLPVGRLIIVRICERRELVSKMNIVVMIAALGMMMGPVLGGIITKQFSWHWIFWVNGPIGLLAAILGYRLLPAMPASPVYALDKRGFFLFGFGLATLTLGLSMLSESEDYFFQSLVVILVSVLFLAVYAWHSFDIPHPIVKIQLFYLRTFRVSVFGNLFSRMGFGGLPFVLPLLLQIGLGFSPQLAGFLIAPMAAGVLFVKPCSLRILQWLGYKKLLMVNSMLIASLLVWFSTIGPHSSSYFIGFLTFTYGLLIALQYTGMNSIAYANLDEQDVSSATSIMSTIQQLSQSFGVAISALVISLIARGSVTQAPLTLDVFHQTFLVLGLWTFCSMVCFLELKPGDGQELIDKNI